MSALLQQLSEQGITEEDLEKAASVHLFQKTAAAEGIDLDEFSEEKVAELFDHFEENVLPGIVGGGDDVNAKLASLSDDDVFFLFEKQAAYEGLTEEDLQSFDNEKLASAFQHFAEDILPQMAANDWEPVDFGGSDKVAEAEATAKLAEADILGRHMAHAFHDELDKLAGVGQTVKNFASAAGTRGKQLLTGSEFKKRTSQGLMAAARGAGPHAGEARKILAARGALGAAGVAAAGGAAYGGKKGYDYLKKKKQEQAGKEASAFEALALEKAASILEANGIDPYTGEPKVASIEDALDARAAEILIDAGYEFE